MEHSSDSDEEAEHQDLDADAGDDDCLSKICGNLRRPIMSEFLRLTLGALAATASQYTATCALGQERDDVPRDKSLRQPSPREQAMPLAICKEYNSAQKHVYACSEERWGNEEEYGLHDEWSLCPVRRLAG